MPATINLLPRKCFEITLEDGTVIKGQFGTWALKRYGDKQKLTLSEIGTRLMNPGIGDMVEYILSAVEYVVRLSGEPFAYSDLHASQWIDQMGGIAGEMLGRLFSHSADENDNEEKKKEET